jgi:hypothetical protein
MNRVAIRPDDLTAFGTPDPGLEYARSPRGRIVDLVRRRQYEDIAAACRGSGGLLNPEWVIEEMRRDGDQPISRLARMIVSREVLCISWQGAMLLPAFQFEHAIVAVRPCCAVVMQELCAVFDEWELALWFTSPNEWLDGESPINSLTVVPNEVLQAARADRFIAMA